MIYETFNPEIHDVSRVARLVYDVDFRTFDMLFSKENAIKAISSDLRKRKITPNLKVVLDDGEIIGMLKVETSHKAHDFRVKSLRLAVVDVLDYFVLCDINDDDFYIAEIAVDEKFRGRGIGRKIILDAIDYAKAKNYRRVILDADFRNSSAKSLYEKLGFKVFNRKGVRLPGFERGMYNMELLL